jgi:hypothetical protein
MENEPKSDHDKFDPEEHAAMKQALRDKDREDLRLGRATAAEIHKRNLFLGCVDMSRAKIVHYGPGAEPKSKARSKK